MFSKSTLTSGAFTLLLALVAHAADWPTWRYDNKRSGVTNDNPDAATLTQSWVHTEPTPPQPAWYGTMQRDAWNNISKAKPARAYDKAFNLIAANGKVFIASSSGNACVALNAADGQPAWRHPVSGAVRLAPAFHNGKIYFGSDDGQAYCLDASDGTPIWSHRGAPDKTLIPADNKLMSRYPCRTGVLIENGKAWCGFGLLPWKDNYLAALNPDTGTPVITKTISAAQWYSLEGPLLATSNHLFALQGRVSPLYFTLSDGNLKGRLPGGGGTFALLTDDDKLIHGPGHGNNSWAKSRTYHLQETNATTGAAISRHSRAHRMLAQGSERFSLIRDAVQASGGPSWFNTLPEPNTLILCGTTLYVGGKNTVIAYNKSNGIILNQWTVKGDVHALAMADNRLLVSTHSGHIYCFQ